MPAGRAGTADDAPGAWHVLPSWYAVSAADRAIDPALQRFMAQRAGSTTVQFSAASHVGGLTHYAERLGDAADRLEEPRVEELAARRASSW
jgi:hypothetical protein